jgi:hypothetical protein
MIISILDAATTKKQQQGMARVLRLQIVEESPEIWGNPETR